jgi:DNA-binding transcriptional MerR regulator
MNGKYSIKDLENLTGIKAHTLRIWEQRYGLVEPHRTDTNIRLYSNDDLKKLLNVSVLVHAGHKISSVAYMDPSALHAAVQTAALEEAEYESQISSLKRAMLDFDETSFTAVLEQSFRQIGEGDTFTGLVAGFIHTIGTLWQTDAISVAQEHFASNLIKQKLYAALDALAAPQPGLGEGYTLLYLPEEELHELGLLYLHYYLKFSGVPTLFLGQSVPLMYLKDVLTAVPIRQVVSVFTTCPSRDNLRSYIMELRSLVPPKANIHLTGLQLNDALNEAEWPFGVHIHPHLGALKEHVV